jgi:hypothetical protein
METSKYKEVKPLLKKLFDPGKRANTPQVNYDVRKNVPFTQINFVDVPNAVQSEISLVNTIDLKMEIRLFQQLSPPTYLEETLTTT